MPDFVRGGGESEFLVVKLERGTAFFLIRKSVFFFFFFFLVPRAFCFQEILGFSLICSVFGKSVLNFFAFHFFLSCGFWASSVRV